MAEQEQTNQGGMQGATPQPAPSGDPQSSADDMIHWRAKDMPAAYGRDMGLALSHANKYREFEAQGLSTLADTLKQHGVTPADLAGRLPTLLNPSPAPQQQAEPMYDPFASLYQPEPLALTVEQANALWEQKSREQQAKFEEMLSNKLGEMTTAQEQAARTRAEEAREQAALMRTMKGLGMERNPVEFDFRGTRKQYDPDYDSRATMLLNAAEDLYRAEWERNGGDVKSCPQFIPDAYIEAAAEGFKDHWVARAVEAGANAVERQNQLSGGSVPAGAGGTPTIGTEDMTDEQLADQAIAAASARGALKGTY